MLDKYKQNFSEERWNELCQLVSDKKMSIKSNFFTVSELEFIFSETVMSENERIGAKLYFIDKKSINEIAEHFGYSESNIKYHKKDLSRRIRETCCRIFK